MRRLAIFCCVLLAGCTSRVEEKTITVYAAASMTDVVTEVVAGYEGVPVKTSFGSSSELARQIEDGAPADVFVSVSKQWADYLKEKDRLDGDYRVFARNTLVCIVPAGSDLKPAAIKDPVALLNKVRQSDARIAIANEGVPAGEYARGALEALGLLVHYKRLLVGQKDVRATLRAVESGEVVAGFVYATDARTSDKVAVLFQFDPATHPSIDYYVAVMKNTRNNAEARAFVDHLFSDNSKVVLTAKGFAPPSTE
jgi:molybdate transport system substrate-binding protein